MDEDANKASKNSSIKFKGSFAAFIALAKRIRELKDGEALNAQQMALIRKSPFGNVMYVLLVDTTVSTEWNKTVKSCQFLWKACKKGIPGQEGVFQFTIDGKTYILRSYPEELSVMYGIPCIRGEGGIEESLLECKSISDCRYGRFYKTHKFTPPAYKELEIKNTELKTKILELVKFKTHNEDLVTMMELFLLSTLFLTTGDGSFIHCKYIGCLE